MRRLRRIVGVTARGTTFVITLPKGWASEMGLRKGEEVQLARLGDGLLIKPDRAPKPRKAEVRAEGRLPEHLVRDVTAFYVAGFDIIEVSSTEALTSEQREAVRWTVGRLIGPEILRESAERMEVHILYPSPNLSPQQALDHLCANVKAMFEDALSAFLEGNEDLAKGVIQRDDDIDRFYLLIFRQFQQVLSDPAVEADWGISRVDFFNLYTVARQLERIADHAVKVAQAALDITAILASLPGYLRETGKEVLSLLEEAFNVFKKRDIERANYILDRARELDEPLSKFGQLVSSKKVPSLGQLTIVLDSLRRARDYAQNIAEAALNSSALLRMMEEGG